MKGNHDLYEIKDYVAVAGFKDIRACVVRENAILTHIPIHPSELGRFTTNIHRHVHEKSLNDPAYVNVCVEKTNYTPTQIE